MKNKWDFFILLSTHEFQKVNKPEKMVRMSMAEGNSFYSAKQLSKALRY